MSKNTWARNPAPFRSRACTHRLPSCQTKNEVRERTDYTPRRRQRQYREFPCLEGWPAAAGMI
jgi:hypothetical protein